MNKIKTYGSIIGYPRSGNNWLRFIIEYLTDYQTAFPPMDSEMRKPLHNLSSHINSTEKIADGVIWNTHWHQDTLLNEVIKSKGKLILMLRNYKECITRHIITPSEINKDGYLTDSAFDKFVNENAEYLEFIHYLKLINYFHNYKGEKEIIYYEDLLSKYTIKKPLEKLILLLDGDKEKIEPFIDSFDLHVNQSKNFYKILGGSKSPKGTKLHHSKALSLEQKKTLDNVAKKLYPHLDKYINIYYE